MAKPKQNREFKNYSVSIVTDDTLVTYPVLDMVNDDLEYVDGFLPVSEGKKFFDFSTGGLHFMYNLDLPAKVEAEKLKTLRRSVAIKNIFSFDKDKGFDLMGFLPWLIIMLLIFFK
ncbi:hypothetical protein JFV29_13865 [Peribacillus sp. TH16]|uniref:hypothetical protein n=1 Tax=Peribacillus sp. TH16 TaxID=2798482 RepID=UPI0019148E56|nr:hypothetical protein [Peribacillus sp. TH16]MBK5482940.1 hypothetical protein [Peribacillus sp. TH16]MBK5482958.1 hypothetical protein [Peribacillus sp. TH16]